MSTRGNPSCAQRFLPSSATICATAVLVALGMWSTGRLPDDHALLIVAACAMALSLLPALLLRFLPVAGLLPRHWRSATKPRRSAQGLLRIGAWVLCACAIAAWQRSSIDALLDARLSADQSGQMHELIGVVDEMVSRSDFGSRVMFRPLSCHAMPPSPDALQQPAMLPQPVSCQLRRVQLDWGIESVGVRRNRLRESPGSEPPPWPAAGELWRVRARLRPPMAAVNPAGIDGELQLLQREVSAIGRVLDRTRVDGEAASRRRPIEVLRGRLRAAIEALPGDKALRSATEWRGIGLVLALSIGEQGAVPPEDWALFSRTGVSHLMAISGSHVTMLALWVAAVVTAALRWNQRVAQRRRCRGGPRSVLLDPLHWMPALLRVLPRHHLVSAIALACAFLYALVSGWGVPAQRTCWMLFVVWCARVAGQLIGGSWSRDVRGASGTLRSTTLAAGLIVLVDPLAVASVGFWLSFVAVMALAWFGVASTEGKGILANLKSAMRSQWAATLALTPLTIAFFSDFSWIGPVSNAFAIPMVGLVVAPVALLIAILAPFTPTLAALLLKGELWLVDLLMSALRLLDATPDAVWTLARPGPFSLIAALLAATLLLAPRGFPARRFAWIGLVPLFVSVPEMPLADELRVTAWDIGSGSAVLVESGSHRVLVDTGNGDGDQRAIASRVILPALKRRGLRTIDGLVITHLDREHAGGAAAVERLLRPAWLLSDVDPRALGLGRDDAMPCSTAHVIPLGRARIEVIGAGDAAADPDRSLKSMRDNASSCVLRIVGPGGSLLVAGDLPAREEAALLRRAGRDALRADLLVLPQQGSRHGAGRTLLDAVGARWAIAQLSLSNSRRRVHAEVEQRLASAGTELLRTDRDGAIELRFREGSTVRITRARAAPGAADLSDVPFWRIRVP